MSKASTRSVWKKYGFAWVTLGLFAISFVGHWDALLKGLNGADGERLIRDLDQKHPGRDGGA